MQEAIKNTFILFISRIGDFALFVLPFLGVSLLETSPLIKLPITMIISIFTAIYIYLYILKPNDMHLLKSWRLVLKFALIDWSIASVLYLIAFFSQKTLGNLNPYLSYVILYLIGLYFLTRFSIILAILTDGALLSFKNILQTTKESYLTWIIAGTVIYAPFIALRLYFQEGWFYQVIYAIQIPWICCFNACYYLRNKKCAQS